MPNPNFVFEAVLAPGGVAIDESLIKSIELSYSRPENGRMVHYYTITKTNGDTQTLTIFDGKDGTQGNGIAEIEYLYTESTTEGSRDYYEIHFTDGTSYPFSIMNGKSAYLYATGAGYTGTEAQFAEKLAFVHPSWALQATKPTYTASEVGADAKGTASSAVSEHNTSVTAHNDLRTVVQDLIDQVTSLLNTDDKTLDETREIVAYIKANRTLIENVTDTKVNVADIIDNLVTNVANKPLSAAQGVVLKALIDAIPSWAKESTKPSYTKSDVGLGNVDNVKQYSASNPPPYPVTSVNGKTGAVTVSVPSKVSELTNDSGYLTQHQSLSGYAKTADHYTKTESDNKYQPKGNYLTSHQDISGKADKSSAETWTFTLKDGSTVTKKVVLA